MPKYYTPLQAAALLGLSKNTMYKHIREGTIKSVRIGVGRIRIPVSEVTKLVDITEEMVESTEPVVEATTEELVPQELTPQEEAVAQSDTGLVANNLQSEDLSDVHEESEGISVYDWFVGLAALMVVLTLFLFDYSSGVGVGLSPSITWWIRGAFFFWGFAHILLSLWIGAKSLIKRGSYLVGAGLFGVMVGVVSYGVTPKIGTSLYVGMSLGLMSVAFWPVSLMKRYLMHLVYAAIAVVVFNYVLPGYGLDSWQLAQLNSGGASQIVVALMAIIIGLTVLTLIMEAKSRIGFLIVNSILVVVSLYCAYLLTVSGVWDRAMLMVVWAVFGGLFPFAPNLSWGTIRNKTIVAEWVVIMAIMVGVVSAVTGMITEMRRTYLDDEVKQNLATIHTGINREVKNAKDRIETVASSKLLLSALKEQDLPIANEYMRDAVRGSDLFLQMLLLDKDGTVVAYYPETVPSLVGRNLGSRDYFVNAVRGEYFVSEELFQANIASAPWVAAMSMPIVDENGLVVGVLAGRLNLEVYENVITSTQLTTNELVYLTDVNGRLLTSSSVNRVDEQYSTGEVASISQVSPGYLGSARSRFLSEIQTDCCGWKIISVQAVGQGQIQVFELTGLVMVLGVMVLVTIAIFAVVWMGRGNKQPTLGVLNAQ